MLLIKNTLVIVVMNSNKISILTLIIIGFIRISYGQNSLTAFVKDDNTKEPLIGVNVVLKGTINGASADTNGRVILESNISKTEIKHLIIGYSMHRYKKHLDISQ